MKAKRISTGEVVEVSELTFTNMKTNVICRRDKKNGGFIAESDLIFLPDTKDIKNEIEGWATIDYPGDDVVVHLTEPYKWKFQPEDKDEYWVSRGTKYNFADSLFPNLTPEKPQKVRITITPKDLLDAHEAGAIGALSGQWRKDTDTEGLKDGDQVIVAIQRVDNSIKYFYAAYFQNGKFWYESDDSEVSLFNIWMMLPEPPKE